MVSNKACPLCVQVPSQPTCLSWAHDEHGWLLAVGTKNGNVFFFQHSPQSKPGAQQQQQQQGEGAAATAAATAGWHLGGQLQFGKGPVRCAVLSYLGAMQGVMV